MNWTTFFKLYNEKLESAFDTAFELNTDPDNVGTPDFEEALKHSVLNSMQSWYYRTFDELDGRTPESLIDGICDLDEAIAVFVIASQMCDNGIPEYLKIKLGSFGNASIQRLTDIAMSGTWIARADDSEPSTEMMSSAMALRLLGEWESVASLDEFLDKFSTAGNPDEFVADAFKSYIEGIGSQAIPFLVNHLDRATNVLADTGSAKNFTTAHEYILIALTSIGRLTPEDKVFACLRKCFRTMEHRVIGAVCIGDYGDPRGIAVLKSYLDNPLNTPDRQIFYEILSSIRRLGGQIHDIKDPFRDFSLKR